MSLPPIAVTRPESKWRFLPALPASRDIRVPLRAAAKSDEGCNQPTTVYTLQLAAYRRQANVRRFLTALPTLETDVIPWTRIYRETPKDCILTFNDESDNHKSDPIYLCTRERMTCVRYGTYENPADAARDVAKWQQQFHVTPYITRVSLNRSLVRRVIRGDLPGIIEEGAFVLRAR